MSALKGRLGLTFSDFATNATDCICRLPGHCSNRFLLPVLLAFCCQLFVPPLYAQPNRGWDARFNLPLVDPHLHMASLSNTLFIAGNLPKGQMVSWDGDNWKTLSDHDSDHRFLAVHNVKLYSCTETFDSGKVGLVQEWDGEVWKTIGNGLGIAQTNGTGVANLVSRGTGLYAFGNFDSIDGKPAACLARWDGAHWSPIGSANGLEPLSIKQIFWMNNTLYAHGYFLEKAGPERWQWYGPAKLDGDVWVDGGLPLDTDSSPWGLGIAPSLDGKRVYFFGRGLGEINNVEFSGIVAWDGVNWFGPRLPEGGFVSAVLPLEAGALIAHGSYLPPITHRVNNSVVYRWNFRSLEKVAEVDGQVGGMFNFQGRWVLVGNFEKVNGQYAGNFAISDGSIWRPMVQGDFHGLNGPANALATDGTNVFAIGEFTHAGTKPVSPLIQWDGEKWTSLLDGFQGKLSCLAWAQDALFVGGEFTSIGGIVATNVAKRTASGWSAVGQGLPQPVYTISINEDKAFAVTTSEVWEMRTNLWRRIATTNSWHAVFSTRIYNDDFYVAGMIDKIDGLPVSQIARWDGTTWSDMQGGVTGNTNFIPNQVMLLFVGALEEWNGSLIVGGSFTHAGVIYAGSLAGWTGDSWFKLSPDFGQRGWFTLGGERANMEINLLGTENGLYMAAFGQLSRWDGRTFTPCGGGASSTFADLRGQNNWEWPQTAAVRSMVAVGDQVFLGGDFLYAGANPSYGFAIWHETPSLFIERRTEGLEIRWPSWATNYVLQTADQLAPGAWVNDPAKSPVIAPPPLPGQSRYYRLQQQSP